MKDNNSTTIWDKALATVRTIYNFLVKIPISKFCKVILYVIIILAIYSLFNWVNREVNMGAFEKISEKTLKTTAKEAFIEGAANADSMKVLQKIKESSISDDVDNNLNDISLNILNRVDADRSLISLFHDGKYTSGNIDFKFMNECYEKTAKKRNITRVTGYCRDYNKRYEDIPTRDLPIYRYLRQQKEKYFLGNIQALSKIDPEYANRMVSDGMGFTAMYYIHEDGLPLSIISVSWKKGNERFIPDSTTLIKVLKEYASEAFPYLYMDAYNKMKQSLNLT